MPPYKSQHLFQLCNSHNWDAVEECYNEVKTALADEDKCNKPREDTILKLNLKYILKFRDDWGNTPLHIACFNRAPPNAIEYLLKLSDIAGLGDDKNAKGIVLSHEVVTTQITNDGSTPLLIACGMNMSLASIKHLIFYHNYKLGAAATGKLLRMSDSAGLLPLSYLLITKQEALRSQDDWLDYLNKIRLLIFFFEHSNSATDELNIIYSDLEREEYDVEPKVLYFKTILKVLTICPFSCPRSSWMENFSRQLSEENEAIIENCLKHYDDISRIRDGSDDQLQNPLQHLLNASCGDIVALCAAVNNASSENTERYLTNQATVIHFILKISPEFSRELIDCSPPNNDGREKSIDRFWQTPLCCAVSNGLWWDTSCKDKIIRGPIASLCESAPEIVQQKDVKTGLYPFMLAASIVDTGVLKEEGACIQHGQSKSDKNTFGNRRLSTIYGLLRMSPQLACQS